MRAWLLLLIIVAAPGCLRDLIGEETVHPTDYIRDGTYTRWTIEIDHSPGQAPDQAWLDGLQQRLQEVVRKERITFVVDDELPSDARWTDGEIAGLEDRFKDHQTDGNTVVTWVAYLDGRYEADEVLGVTYGWDRIVIFSDRIETGCDVTTLCIGNENTIQLAVLVHEFGHAIGLVDRGVPMVNPHTDGSRHSNNANSVMAPAVHTTGVFALNSIPTRFDSNDKLDLCAAGGKGSC